MKNCSLSIVLMATDQKPQKNIKIITSHRLNVNLMLSNITSLMIFLQILVLIFAVLLSKLCNELLCNYKIYLSNFSILKIGALCRKRLSKIKKLNFTSGAGDCHEGVISIVTVRVL